RCQEKAAEGSVLIWQDTAGFGGKSRVSWRSSLIWLCLAVVLGWAVLFPIPSHVLVDTGQKWVPAPQEPKSSHTSFAKNISIFNKPAEMNKSFSLFKGCALFFAGEIIARLDWYAAVNWLLSGFNDLRVRPEPKGILGLPFRRDISGVSHYGTSSGISEDCISGAIMQDLIPHIKNFAFVQLDRRYLNSEPSSFSVGKKFNVVFRGISTLFGSGNRPFQYSSLLFHQAALPSHRFPLPKHYMPLLSHFVPLPSHLASLTAIDQPSEGHDHQLQNPNNGQHPCKPRQFPLGGKLFVECLLIALSCMVIACCGVSLAFWRNGRLRSGWRRLCGLGL